MDKKSGKKNNRKDSDKKAMTKTKVTEKIEKTNHKKQLTPNIPPMEKVSEIQKPIISEFNNDEQDVLQISQPVENKFKKREIQSNWSRYEPMTDHETDDDVATNFENLINAPISVGGHFKFKSEKILDNDISSEYRDFFNLNIHKLAENLETIPFYKRHDLDATIFSLDEIKTMNGKCSLVEHESADKILKLLGKTSNEASKPIVTKLSDPTNKSAEDITFKNTTSRSESSLVKDTIKTQLEDDLDELLTLKSPVKNLDIVETDLEFEPDIENIAEKPIVLPISSKANLENWLDDLLQ